MRIKQAKGETYEQEEAHVPTKKENFACFQRGCFQFHVSFNQNQKGKRELGRERRELEGRV
jgi:hypothetical protein